MLNKDYYILLSMIETVDKIIFFGINVDLVWQIIQKDIPLFRAELKNMTEN